MTSRRSSSSRRLARLAGAPAVAVVLLGSASALAQQPPSSCPPGSWFCADTTEEAPAPAARSAQPAPAPAQAQGQALEPLPLPEAERPAAPPPPPPGPPPPIHTQGPIIIYQQAPPPAVVYQPPPPARQAPPPYYYRPRPAKTPSYFRNNEWGLNLHVQGALLGGDSAGDSGMGGLGLGLRYKPVPYFGLEADLDFYGGRDYNGDQRTEDAFALNALFFVNPKSRVQLYFLAGFGWSGATVQTPDSSVSPQQQYHYFGGQAGAGLEFRLATHFALNADVRGFVRGRTDDNAQYQPEFVNPQTGQTTNTSGGGLVTAGMTFYF